MIPSERSDHETGQEFHFFSILLEFDIRTIENYFVPMSTDKKDALRIRPPVHDACGIAPSETELLGLFYEKYRKEYGIAQGPTLRINFGYISSDDYYEAIISKLVTNGCTWTDIGCGRDIFPTNRKLAQKLADKADYLLGIDPDDNIKENTLITEKFQGMIEDVPITDKCFDVVSMRMVAEHIANPDTALRSVAKITKPNGLVVVYTPNKWSPMSIAAAIVPFRHHNTLKRIVWRTERRDTFPTEYKLNTRRDLNMHFQNHGLKEIFFTYLDDCSLFQRYRILNRLELTMRGLFYRAGIRHPENSLLGVYQKM